MRIFILLLLTLPSFAQNQTRHDLETYFSAYYEEVRSAVQEHKENLEKLRDHSEGLKKCQLDQKYCLTAMDEVVRTSVYSYFNAISLDDLLETEDTNDARRSKLRSLKVTLDQLTLNPEVLNRTDDCQVRLRESSIDSLYLKIYLASRCAYGLPLEGDLVTGTKLTELLEVALADFAQTLERLDQFRIENPSITRMDAVVIQVLREAYQGKD